jgi:hypothetical protein
MMVVLGQADMLNTPVCLLWLALHLWLMAICLTVVNGQHMFGA